MLNKADQKKVLGKSVSTLHAMLMFATTVDIQRYILSRQASNYSDFEMEVEASRDPNRTGIDGTGVLALRSEIEKDVPPYEDDFFHDNIGLGSHELGAYIDAFPLDAAAASHLFTLLEVYGNEVAAIVSPNSIERNKAWHEDIKGFADLRDNVQVDKAREAFAKHFNATAADVPELAARRMVRIKRARNDFAHEGEQTMGYRDFLHDTLAVVCHIAFLTTDEVRLSVYPWEDHLNIFTPQTEASN